MTEFVANQTTLYKRDTTGRPRSWQIIWEGDSYYTVAGLIDGQKVVSAPTVATPKNVGKVNETSPEKQAELESLAEIKKQLAQGGYFRTIEEIDNESYFEPMLATPLEKIKGGLDFAKPLFSQAKYDGVRSTTSERGIISRQGKPILTVPHVVDALDQFFIDFPHVTVDGELYSHEYREDFNEIISLVRKQKPGPDDLAATRDKIVLNVYDVAGPGISALPYADRIAWIQANLEGKSPYIVVAPTVLVTSQEQLDELFAGYVEEGFEGQIIRLNGPYENKRSKFLIKRKEFQDIEIEIERVEAGSGNWAIAAKRIVGKLEDGRRQDAGVRGSKTFLAQVLAEADEYAGGTATVRFMNYTPDGFLRFPIAVALFKGKRDL